MKTIHVAAAVICDDPAFPREIFATARGYGPQKGLWEFPGGKLEPGETAEAALIREIREELSVTVSVSEPLGRVEYDDPRFHLIMDCFLCKLESGSIRLLEAEDARWLRKSELNSVPWLPADKRILSVISQKLQ